MTAYYEKKLYGHWPLLNSFRYNCNNLIPSPSRVGRWDPANEVTITNVIIEGLRAKRVYIYIGFWPICIFCRIELIFDPVLFWREKHCSIILFFGRFVLCSPEIMYAKNLSISLETFCWTKNKRNLLFC